MTSPTFVVAGAQRSGTTTLWHLLDRHPEVFLARPPRPEPKYFLADERPGRDRDWYERTWFADTGDVVAVGEKSTSYLDDPAAPDRMRRQYPELRVVVCLRHPFERAVSNYRFSRAGGFETESFDRAVRDEAERLATLHFDGVSAHPLAYLWRSRYAERLRPLRAAFPPEQLHVLLFEDLLANPEPTLAALHRFLGVTVASEGLAVPHENRTPAGPLEADANTWEFVAEQLRDSNRELAEWLGRDLSHWDEPTPALLRQIQTDV